MPVKVKNAMRSIARHVDKIIEELDNTEIEEMMKQIKGADKIFLIGAGRSGLVGKTFAMRLAQLGLTVYVIGESVTPAMSDKDLLIAISGSGETSSVVNAAKTAKGVGSKILAVTSYPKSSLCKVADSIVVVKGRTKIDIEKDHIKNLIEGTHTSLTPLGTLFEDSVMIFFDGVTAGLMTRLRKGEADLKNRHATLE
ncbi:MAG: 6-phospho-3-hexuloisomerase [Candidatus Altiarchaeota archaeon]|nr:6-phospho-3-hexuloisomerase [Candidatus Altiarchaeota archaeon]